MTERDEVYYARRASEERMRSQNANDPVSYKAHLELAREYERRAAPLKLPTAAS